MRALRQLGRRVVGGRPQLLRDMVAVADAGPSLLGKRIVLDAGHGGSDTGVVADGLVEAELVWDLVSRLDGRLNALGVQTWLTRGPDNGASDEQRAELANAVGADLVLSLHTDGFASPTAPTASPPTTTAPANRTRRSASGWPTSRSASWWPAPACATVTSTARPGRCCA